LYESLDDAEGMPIEELVSGKTMAERPELVWKHLLRIEQACRGAKPNRGHEVIAEMERAFERVWVLTQNVDGFHRLAGSRNVIDIHGDLHRVRCMKCAYSASVSDYAGFAVPPRCPDCGGILRPDVVLFGEPIAERQSALYRTEVAQRFDLVLSIGTTSVFPYISAPVLDQYHFRKQIVEINPGETEVSDFATVRVPMPAAGALDAIWREYKTDA
jgi:NAD-dependent deacetylase